MKKSQRAQFEAWYSRRGVAEHLQCEGLGSIRRQLHIISQVCGDCGLSSPSQTLGRCWWLVRCCRINEFALRTVLMSQNGKAN